LKITSGGFLQKNPTGLVTGKNFVDGKGPETHLSPAAASTRNYFWIIPRLQRILKNKSSFKDKKLLFIT